MLTQVFGDPETAAIFSEERIIEDWLATEAALAGAQADAGVIERDEADAVAAAAVLANIDVDVLWRETRNVGYPILPLVRMIVAALPAGVPARVHYGATTQDIMDTAFALQMRDAIARLDELVVEFGDRVAAMTDAHRRTVLAARTHAQQAVPTTLGMKFAVLLAELGRHRDRLAALRPRAARVSLFGAGGTSAALGDSAPAVRAAMAERLGLQSSDVPWHVARDSVAEFGAVCAGVASTCARFAREVIDLSRTEIGELGERAGHHRGASSTMPQKANPISSEVVVGMAAMAGAVASALFRAMQGGHDRAAGEWQIEWEALPLLAMLAAGCARHAGDVAEGLRVFPDAMRRNLAGQGFVMAEAYMMQLAPRLGREEAHDAVYQAVRQAQAGGETLEGVLEKMGLTGNGSRAIAPDEYVGSPDIACDAALEAWRAMTRPAA
jgi:3-carboxy-cis,cis-muconate cycloisomerase